MFNLLFIKVGILCTFHSLYIFDINDNLVLILPINECFGEIFTMHKGIIPTFKRFYTSLCNKFNFHSFLHQIFFTTIDILRVPNMMSPSIEGNHFQLALLNRCPVLSSTHTNLCDSFVHNFVKKKNNRCSCDFLKKQLFFISCFLNF